MRIQGKTLTQFFAGLLAAANMQKATRIDYGRGGFDLAAIMKARKRSQTHKRRRR